MANEIPSPPEAKEVSVVRDATAIEVQNKRPTMEDTHYIETDFGGQKGALFAGVYDGHGGVEAADLAKAALHTQLIKYINQGLSQEEALKEAYLETSNVIKQNLPETVGCTAATILIEGNILYFANVGDAGIVAGGKETVSKLSKDHKPNDPYENKRITDAGGIVMSDRVFSRESYGPKNEPLLLNVSRALGDASHEGLVIPDPHVGKIELTEDYTDIILASDALWETIYEARAVEIAQRYDDATEAAEALKKTALESGLTTDNITVAVIKLNPEALKVEEVTVEKEITPRAPTPRPPFPLTAPPLAAPPRPAAPRTPRPVPATPRVEPAAHRVEPARPAAAAPEAPAREPLTAAEQQLAAKLMEKYQQKFVPEGSAEPYFGERGRTIERVPVEEKKELTSVFQEEMHPLMVKNARDIEMGRKTAEEIAAAMTKEEIFFTYFSDPEHIETRQDLVGLGHALTLLMEKRLAAYYGVREYKFDEEFKRDTQKESDVTFLKQLVKERNEHPDKLAEIREINELFWMRFSIDRRLRGESYEEGAARRQELEFEAIKDGLNRFARWRMGRRVERMGDYESFVAAFTNVEANRYLDGILKRRMDDMGIAAAERTEALTAPEGVEVSDDIISITEIADLLTGDEGMTLVAKILQEIVKTKKELGDKDTLMQMSRDLGLRLGEKFIDKTAASVRKARQVSVEQDIQSWLFAFLAALIYAITHRER